jgi:AraC-like DNA-binding protein
VLAERIKLAKKWLKKADCSITQACFNSGFENLSHFTSAFKKEEGISPSAFKKNNRLSNSFLN